MKITNCKRCGATPTIETYDGREYFRVKCENGHAWDEWLDTEEEAIEAWNEEPALLQDIRGYLVAAADGSMSRNNSEQLASELLQQIAGN
jgi:hypothetical protein